MVADAGLEVEKWTAALDSKATEAAVAAHKQACNALGVDRGTPRYFVNGRMIKDVIKTENFRHVGSTREPSAHALFRASG
jgi:protein-disulfide isomerase